MAVLAAVTMAVAVLVVIPVVVLAAVAVALKIMEQTLMVSLVTTLGKEELLLPNCENLNLKASYLLEK